MKMPYRMFFSSVIDPRGNARPEWSRCMFGAAISLGLLSITQVVFGQAMQPETTLRFDLPPVRLSEGGCKSRMQMIERTKVPANASVTAATETTMFLLVSRMEIIEGGCIPGATPDQIQRAKREMQISYLKAEEACNSVQSDGRRCSAQVHTVVDAAPPPLPKPSVQQPSERTYDPVTGRCLPPGSNACQQLPTDATRIPISRERGIAR